MIPTNLPPKSNSAHLNTGTRMILMPSAGLFLRVGAILILAGLLASGFYWSSASSASRNASPNQKAAVARDEIAASSAIAEFGGLPLLRVGNFSSLLPVPQAGISVTTYAGDCTTPKSVFNLQDTDKTVCAKVTGADPSWRIIWSNAKFVSVQNVAVGSGESTFTLTSASSLGDWRVILFEPFGGSVYAVTSFTVIDAANPSADLSISKGPISGNVASGGQAIFAVQVTNAGPSDATAAQVSDTIPSNTSFVSFNQLSGPVFSCTSPTAGSTSGSTVCTIASLARGESATFIATYEVGAVASGTVISNTASVSSTTPDPNSDNNNSTADVAVAATPCQITSLDNITVNADTGQAGAVVTYSTPSSTGDCGQATTGENGETVPVISCNPASGSFFPIGTTTVICVAQAGAAASFQVTVDNPGGGLTVSLNGANPLTHECGNPFGDPGATAINGAGQSVPVTISGATCDSDGNCISRDTNPGTYTLTYTATDGSNSVSTTRTVIVSDTQPPHITIDGANPYKIQQGSCSPFVDPGVSATDDCEGSVPVTSSISGPSGATSVNTSIAGTYTVTYTATDGSHQATATRTVLVGTFPEDEVDQPASSNVPPTITLNGDDQISIECGTPFTDPGATATVCGGSVAVTTTGTVDIHAPGTYSITYSATANGFTSEASRIVTVEADSTAPTITLDGTNPITVECHTGTFTDPGATAHDACAGDFPATASGTVNIDVVGPYTITYNATDPSGHAATPVTRTVNVVDTTAPVVTAPVNVTVYTGPGATSCDATVTDATLGTASANDACEGSVATSRSGVPAGNVFPVGQTTVAYSATDANNNTGTATQLVTVIDNTPPTITLTGANPQVVECHTSYTDLGATANDACSGSVAVTSTNDVNVNTPGSYTVTYSASDGAGNTQTATRTVNVVDTIAPTIAFNNLTIFFNNLTIVFNTNTFTVNGTTYPFNGISCTHDGYTFTFNGQTVTITKNGYSFTYTFSGNTLVLWTPTHQYQTVKVADLIASATDGCDANVDLDDVVISQVTSDEPENVAGGGDGNTLNDIIIPAGCKSVQLRAERNGSGNGRVYTITMRVRDAAGNTTTVNSKLKIFANSFNVVDNGPQYTVNGTCP